MKKNLYTIMKRHLYGCLLSACLLMPSLAVSQDYTTDLKMYYNFEDVSGTTVNDATTNNLDGTLQGSASIVTAYSGQGVTCTANTDYMVLPQDLLTGTTSFTFATWAYFNSANSATRFFDFGNIAGDNNPDDFLCFMPNNGSGYARMRYRPTGGTNAVNCDATTTTPVGQWAHIAITYSWDANSSTGSATIYINGVASGTASYTAIFSIIGTGTTTNNFIGHSRWLQDTNPLNATLDEIRLYTRALSDADITALYSLSSRDLMILNGYPETLLDAQENLTIEGDLTAVTSPLTLSTTATGGVSISWSSSNSAVVDSSGNIYRPESYDATVILTATLSQVSGDKTYTLTKPFTVIVSAFNTIGYQLAKWTFPTDSIKLEDGVITVTDESESGFVATLMNEASIRTIGETEQFNVLDLGNGTGYLDMGLEIGEAIYSLNNYTMCGYFRIDDDYEYLDTNGNFYWTFSNTADAMNDPTGYIIGSLKSQGLSISSGRYDNGNQAVNIGSNASVGAWHHFAYTQNEETGTVYIDGVEMATGTITNLPSLTLPREGRTGTIYNWLGRSNYTSDVYLRKTLLYDFQLWRDALSGDDLNFEFSITEMLEKLNNAYAEDSCYQLPELTTERDALTIEGLSAITGDITLPTKGTIDTTIAIFWKSNIPDILDANGYVVRPDYYPVDVVLTATFFKNGQSVTKTFDATVLEMPGTAFTSNLLVKHDFATVDGTLVTDAAEKHFVGTLVDGADIRPIGESTVYNTLDLTDSTGYFDMGTSVGRILYNLSDYTMSCYYRVDSANTYLSNAGNFLWTFSNSDKTGTDQNGALFGGLRSQSVVITPEYWSTGEQSVSAGVVATTGGWHHLAYTQKDTIGTLFVDGMSVMTDTITWLPSNTLPIDGRTGTLYNWLGRSCYVGDAYLSKTLVYDFRIYDKALTEEEIQMTELSVGTMINALEAAYAENPNIPQAIKTPANSTIKVYTTSNGIRIHGLTGTEKVTLYDITGRQIHVANPSDITISRGLYLVKVENIVTKVFVR